MPKYNELKMLMREELPGLTFQRRLSYRTSIKEVWYLYNLINQEIFRGKLPRPKIEVASRCREYWGICMARNFIPDINSGKSECTIRLSDKWFCRQWLITVLAHEMCHQYQWDILSKKRMKQGMKPLISHGPSFFAFRKKLAKYGIALKRAHGQCKWFRHQDLFKC